ncbi:hypothetical protein HaLaN_06852, partial [Haematococcus lacustris]
MAKKKRKGTAKQKKGPAKKPKASRSPQGRQRQERRNGWETKRRQWHVKVLIVLGRRSSRSRVGLCCAGAKRRSASYRRTSSCKLRCTPSSA